MLIEDFIDTSILNVELSRVSDLERRPQQGMLARRLAHGGIFSWDWVNISPDLRCGRRCKRLKIKYAVCAFISALPSGRTQIFLYRMCQLYGKPILFLITHLFSTASDCFG